MAIFIEDATNATPIVITSSAHGLATNDIVQVVGVVGNLAANGVWQINVLDADTFELNDSVGHNAYVSGGSGYKITADPSGRWGEDIDIMETTSVTGTSDPVDLLGPVAGKWPYGILKEDEVIDYAIDYEITTCAYAQVSGELRVLGNVLVAEGSSTSSASFNPGHEWPVVTVFEFTNPVSFEFSVYIGVRAASPVTSSSEYLNVVFAAAVVTDWHVSLNSLPSSDVLDEDGFDGGIALNDIIRITVTDDGTEVTAVVFNVTTATTLSTITAATVQYADGDCVQWLGISGPAVGTNLTVTNDGEQTWRDDFNGTDGTILNEFGHQPNVMPAPQFENGIGTYNSVTNTLSRDVILSTSESDDPSAPCDFAAGTKIVSSHIEDDPSEDGGEENFVSTTGGGAPAALVGGTFSMRDIRVDGNDDNRTGPSANTLYFVPNVTNPSLIRLLQTRSNAFVWQIGRIGSGQAITQAYREVTLTSGTTALRLAVNLASPMPFLRNAAKLPANAGIEALKPADVFIYLPHKFNVNAQNFPPNVAPNDPTPVLFYMNWYSETARNNGNAGAPIGHDLATDDDWTFLAVTGDFSTYITDPATYVPLPRRYLYLGTICGLESGKVVFRDQRRLFWNKYQKISYSYVSIDTTPNWCQNTLNLTRNSFSPMNGAAYVGTFSPWNHCFLNGLVDSCPRLRAEVTCNGNCRIRLRRYDGDGTGGAFSNLTTGTGPNATVSVSEDFANDSTIDGGLFVNLLTVNGFDLSKMGLHTYKVMEAIGTNPLAPQITPTPATPRFFGNNAPVIGPGAGGIVFAVAGQNFAVETNAGPARTTVEGNC